MCSIQSVIFGAICQTTLCLCVCALIVPCTLTVCENNNFECDDKTYSLFAKCDTNIQCTYCEKENKVHACESHTNLICVICLTTAKNMHSNVYAMDRMNWTRKHSQINRIQSKLDQSNCAKNSYICE